jgi:hypothetical protein
MLIDYVRIICLKGMVCSQLFLLHHASLCFVLCGAESFLEYLNLGQKDAILSWPYPYHFQGRTTATHFDLGFGAPLEFSQIFS